MRTCALTESLTKFCLFHFCFSLFGSRMQTRARKKRALQEEKETKVSSEPKKEEPHPALGSSKSKEDDGERKEQPPQKKQKKQTAPPRRVATLYKCTPLGSEKIKEWEKNNEHKENPWWDAVIHVMRMSSESQHAFTIQEMLKCAKQQATAFYTLKKKTEKEKEVDEDDNDPELEYWVTHDEVQSAASDMKKLLRSKSLVKFIQKWQEKGYWLDVAANSE